MLAAFVLSCVLGSPSCVAYGHFVIFLCKKKPGQNIDHYFGSK